jgi:hypothetical protein
MENVAVARQRVLGVMSLSGPPCLDFNSPRGCVIGRFGPKCRFDHVCSVCFKSDHTKHDNKCDGGGGSGGNELQGGSRSFDSARPAAPAAALGGEGNDASWGSKSKTASLNRTLLPPLSDDAAVSERSPPPTISGLQSPLPLSVLHSGLHPPPPAVATAAAAHVANSPDAWLYRDRKGTVQGGSQSVNKADRIPAPKRAVGDPAAASYLPLSHELPGLGFRV